jgi:hypothetical protein
LTNYGVAQRAANVSPIGSQLIIARKHSWR